MAHSRKHRLQLEQGDKSDIEADINIPHARVLNYNPKSNTVRVQPVSPAKWQPNAAQALDSQFHAANSNSNDFIPTYHFDSPDSDSEVLFEAVIRRFCG